jgi:hypothetical protein
LAWICCQGNQFDCRQLSSGCDSVPSFGEKITDNPTISGPFVGVDEQFLYEETLVRDFEISYSLEQVSYFVCKSCFPHRICCRILDEMPLLQNGACVFVNDGAEEMISGELG